MTDPSLPKSAGHARATLACLLLAAAALRLPALDTVPPPLNQDEASRGYDAWCILDTGADRHGQHRPFFLESFGPGDFTAALSTYFIVPFVALLGPTVLAFRLPGAILSVLTVGFLFDWLRRRFGFTTAVIAAFALVLDPWHVSITRTAYEFGYAPFFLSVALWALDRAGLLQPLARESVLALAPPPARLRWAALSGGMFALHAWVYPATRMFTPLFLLAIAALGCGAGVSPVQHKRDASATTERSFAHPWRQTFAFMCSLMVMALPLWWTALFHPERLAARARVAMLDFHPSALSQSIPEFIGNYLRYFDPRYLWTQPDTITAVPIPGVGLHLVVMAPLILIGVVLMIARARRTPIARLLLAWWLLSPLPAAVCRDIQPHMIRTISAMLLWPILAGIGGQWLVANTARFSRFTRRTLAIAAVTAAAINVGYFAHQYFRAYARVARVGFQSPLIEALQYAAARADRVDFVLVTNRANQPYIYAMLFQPIPPRDLAKTPMIWAPGPANFDQVVRVGKYFFVPLDPANYPEAQRRFAEQWSTLPTVATGLVIEQPGLFQQGRALATFSALGADDLENAYEVREWTMSPSETKSP